jgi:hypothetical protein
VIGSTLALGSYALFCRLEGRNPPAELLYEAKLARLDLRELDRRAAQMPRCDDLVVCLTSLPSRLPHLQATLKSLLMQALLPAEVRVHLPRFSAREGRGYEVPRWLLGLRCVRVVRCDDDGPITKVLPALREGPPDQRIVAVDDDRIYLPTLLEDLDRASRQHPDAALCTCGQIVPDDRVDRRRGLLGRTLDGLRWAPGVSLKGSRLQRPLPVDVFHGFGGVLTRPRYFDIDALGDRDGAPQAAFFEDDTWLSGHCRARKLLIPCRRPMFPRYRGRRGFDRSSLGRINRGPERPEERNTTTLMRHFDDRWGQDETG